MSYLEESQRLSIIEAVVHLVNRDFEALADLYERMGFIAKGTDTARVGVDALRVSDGGELAPLEAARRCPRSERERGAAPLRSSSRDWDERGRLGVAASQRTGARVRVVPSVERCT